MASKIESKSEPSFPFSILLYAFFFSLFLTLGSDAPGIIQFRIGFGFLLVVMLALDWIRRPAARFLDRNPSLWLLGIIAVFSMIRWMVGGSSAEYFDYYQKSLMHWMFYTLFFMIALHHFKQVTDTRPFLWLTAFSGFFLTMNIMPALLIDGRTSYLVAEGRYAYFPPFYYFHDWVGKFLLGSRAHRNWTGDIVAFGFFAAAGLFLQAFMRPKDRYRRQDPSGMISWLGLSGLFAGVSALGVILFFSRGTILAFAASNVIFIILFLARFRSGKAFLLMGAVIVIGLAAIVGAANVGALGKELQTLETELDAGKASSFSANREGSRRALGIYRDHAFWGTGATSYSALSGQYATEENKLANFYAMSHYFQTLAEEGLAAWFYFLFLILYAFEFLFALIRVRDPVRYLTAIALAAPVILVLGHAAINHLLQNFVFSALVFMMMGAALGVLQPREKSPA